MSKKQLCGLETSPWGVPRSRWKVQCRSREGVVPKPGAAARDHASSAHGERMAVGPPRSMVASQWEMSDGTPKRVQLSSIAWDGVKCSADVPAGRVVSISSACSRALINWGRAVSVPRPGRKPSWASVKIPCRSQARVIRVMMIPTQSLRMTSREMRGQRPSSVTSTVGSLGLGQCRRRRLKTPSVAFPLLSCA